MIPLNNVTSDQSTNEPTQTAKHYFITATDTDAGKTYVACALVNAFVKNLAKVSVYKPISAGGYLLVDTDVDQNGRLNKETANPVSTWANEDALLLQAHANCQQSLLNVNPITFEEPIAPHIAAQKAGEVITLNAIEHGFSQVQELGADIIITEGAGGWRLPLGEGHYLSDFVKSTQQDVILVVNMKLGCLNHAILTYESIINDGLHCVAWVANNQENMPYLAENLHELKQLLPIPLLACLNLEPDIDKASAKFNLSVL